MTNSGLDAAAASLRAFLNTEHFTHLTAPEVTEFFTASVTRWASSLGYHTQQEVPIEALVTPPRPATAVPGRSYACGVLFGSLFTYKHTGEPRPYMHWDAWIAGAAALLVLSAVSGEAARYLALPLAAVETVVGAVLLVLWARRRDGSGDWGVWHPQGRILLPGMVAPCCAAVGAAGVPPGVPHRSAGSRPRVPGGDSALSLP